MASYFVLGSDNREYGPVTVDVLKQWFSEGRLVADTQLREESSPAWKSAREFPEIADFVSPRFVATPAPAPPSPALSSATTKSFEDGDYEVRIGAWISEAWEFYKSSWGEILGFTLLVLVLQIAASSIPCVGGLAGLFINPMLQVGLFYYLLKKKRGDTTDLMDLFVGFKHFYVPTLIANLLLFLIMLAVCLPIIASIVGVVLTAHINSPEQLQPVHWIMFGTIGLATLIVAMYLSVVFIFWYALIPDGPLGGWEALQMSRRFVSKHWLGIFAYFFVVVVIVAAGVLACGIGLLFTIPLGGCCYVTAYDAIFGPRVSSVQPS